MGQLANMVVLLLWILTWGDPLSAAEAVDYDRLFSQKIGRKITVHADGNEERVREAVEERSLDDLALAERFETRFLETPALDPRAFAVNATTGKLYVAYTNKAILEVFPLD